MHDDRAGESRERPRRVEDLELPEGAEVAVRYSGDEVNAQLTANDLAELDAAIAEADRGEGTPAEDVLREIRAMRHDAVRGRRDA